MCVCVIFWGLTRPWTPPHVPFQTRTTAHSAAEATAAAAEIATAEIAAFNTTDTEP